MQAEKSHYRIPFIQINVYVWERIFADVRIFCMRVYIYFGRGNRATLNIKEKERSLLQSMLKKISDGKLRHMKTRYFLCFKILINENDKLSKLRRIF